MSQDQLFESVYNELREAAGRYVAEKALAHGPQATGLVNEAYSKLRAGGTIEVRDRSHFVATAKRAMRQLLVDYAQPRGAKARLGQPVDISISSLAQTRVRSPEDFLALYDALDRLATSQPGGERKAHLVESVWLLGMDLDEAATDLGISPRTAMRDWRYTRVWLHRELSK